MQRQATRDTTAVVIRGMRGRMIILIVFGALVAVPMVPYPVIGVVAIVQGESNAALSLLSLPVMLFGAGLIVLAVFAMRASQVTVDGWGIVVGRSVKPRLRVAWDELTRVGVSWREVTRLSGGRASPLVSTHCQLDLYPADAGFVGRHHGRGMFWISTPCCYRLVVGGKSTIGKLDAALRHHAASRYLGVGAAELVDGQARATRAALPTSSRPAGRAALGNTSTTIDYGRSRQFVVLALGVMLCFLGLVLLLIGALELILGADIGGGVTLAIGAVLAVVAALLIARFVRAKGSLLLTIDGSGLRHHARGGESFAIEWRELNGVGLAWIRGRVLYTQRFSHLELFPAKASCRALHPEMESWWSPVDGRPRYRLTIGDEDRASEVIMAVRRYAPQWFLGVRS